MMHVADFKAENFRDLEKKASEIPWELYFLDDRRKTIDERGQTTLHIHVTCKHSRLYHSDAVAERLYKVIEGGSLPLASATRHPRPFDMLRAGSRGNLPVSFTTPSVGGQHLGACSLVSMATKVGTPRNAPLHVSKKRCSNLPKW